MHHVDFRRSRRFRTLPSLLLLVTSIAVGGVCQGQTGEEGEVVDPNPGPPPVETDLRFLLVKTSLKGGYTYVPGKWGELQMRLENGRDNPRDLMCATSFDVEPTLQFGRRIWMPPHSRLHISHPLKIPDGSQFKDQGAKVHSVIIEDPDVNNVLVKGDSGQMLHEQFLLLTPRPRNTGMIVGPSVADQVPPDALQLVGACRKQQSLNQQVTVLGDHFLPADESLLKYLDHLVLVENRLLDDAAALTAVRRWLHAGGRLWIMLDQVDPRLLEALFGDDFRGQVVDQVELTEVLIENTRLMGAPTGQAGERIAYDEPVKMVRMIVPDIAEMKVLKSVQGWPAAITKPCGQGRLLITTLGARGWMKPKPEDAKSAEFVQLSQYEIRSSIEDLASYILEPRPEEILPQRDLSPLAREQISYQVPSWSLVVGTLFCFVTALIAIGVGLLRWQRLEHLGWTGSLLAIVFGGVLMLIGKSNRQVASEAAASAQFAQAIAGTDDVQTQGAIAVFHPEGSDELIETTHGGELWPDMTGQEGALRRLVMTDLGRSHWQGLTQPAGLRISQFTTSRAFADRIAARATFDANGLVGRYSGAIAPETDALMATRQGRIGVKLGEPGTFSAGAENVFEAGQYLQASFLGDEQDRRRRLLERLFQGSRQTGFPTTPQLIVWLKNWDHGFEFGKQLQRKGDTLLSIPIHLERPASDAEFLIPSPFLSFRSRLSPDGTVPSAIWSDARQEWQERSSFGSNWLRFQVPPELLPITAAKARVQIKASGPMGRLEVLGLKGDAVQSLQVVTDPVGTVTIEISDADVLTVSADGGVSLGVSAGIPSPEILGANSTTSPESAAANPGSLGDDIKANYWRIEALSLQLWAKTTSNEK